MSTLVTSNISDGTTSVGTGYVVNGSAKAWVSFISVGTVSIRDSLNTSSINDNGTGNFDVIFSTSFAANTYVPSCTTWQSTFTNDVNENFPSPNVSYQNLTTLENNTGVDPNHVNLSFHGDLA
jgi:hypothetical protein